MDIPDIEPWPTTFADARAVQLSLAGQVICEDRLGDVTHVAGVDVGFEDQGNTTRAAVAVLSFPSLALMEQAVHREPTRFPYVPGYLSFREIPALLGALAKLDTTPDLILCDGQGYAHPRRFGIACHLGVLLDRPTIGVGKTRLIGTHAEVPLEKGAHVPLIHHDETIGAVLRTRTAVSPVFVSIGHRISLPTAMTFVLQCTTRYRLPETTRQAHRLASG